MRKRADSNNKGDDAIQLPTPGSSVGPYVLKNMISQGGAGSVWTASDSRLGRTVAIKFLNTFLWNDEAIERFEREARALAQFNHPSIIQIYDVGSYGDTPYIVTPFIAGVSLAELLRRGRLRLSWVIPIAEQITEAVQRLHDDGIVHRDIKPSNILIDNTTGRPVLIDLGLAKGGQNLATITAPGGFYGTVAYAPPESFDADDHEVDAASDVYSLGATLFELLTSRLPRSEKNIYDYIRNSTKLGTINAKLLRPEIPNELNTWLSKMLEPNPKKRPTDLNPFIVTLKTLFATMASEDGATAKEGLLQNAIEEQADAIPGFNVDVPVPDSIFSRTVFRETSFFKDDIVRYRKIEETLNFYRDNLEDEYKALLGQAKVTYWLWLGCVALGFLILGAGVVALIMGNISQGLLTAVSSTLIYFIQKVFQQREDHYRTLAAAKNSHLEYGNHWSLVIQSIDAIEDPEERKRSQAQLVSIMTDKLKARIDSKTARKETKSVRSNHSTNTLP